MKPRTSLRAALEDPALLGKALPGDSWTAWRIILIAAMGEALTDDERPTFTALTGGREHEPLERVEEFCAVIGRRGGKSRLWQRCLLILKTTVYVMEAVELYEPRKSNK